MKGVASAALFFWYHI